MNSAVANRATVTMGDQIYGRRVLIPRLELIRSVLQERLMPEFDERLIVTPGNHDVRWNPRGKEGYTRGTGRPLPLKDLAREADMTPAEHAIEVHNVSKRFREGRHRAAGY